MTEFIEKNLREFSRVDAVIPIEVRLVPPEERHHIRSLVTGETSVPEFQLPPEVDDIVLAEWLKMLNAKLDVIMGTLAEQKEAMPLMSQKMVNISGGGLSIESSENYNRGDILEMKMILPLTPASTLYIYGEVVDVRVKDNHYHTAVKFIQIDDEVRDHVVRFVFKTQRDILRKKRG